MLKLHTHFSIRWNTLLDSTSLSVCCPSLHIIKLSNIVEKIRIVWLVLGGGLREEDERGKRGQKEDQTMKADRLDSQR